MRKRKPKKKKARKLIASKRIFYTIYYILFLTLCLSLGGCDSLREGTLAPGRTAPKLELHDLEGNPVSLDSFKGKIVVLNFLASWCQPCATEMPALEALSITMKDQLVVVAVGVQDDDKLLRDFRDRYKVTFTFLHNRSGYAKDRYRLGGYPETFVLNREGELLMLPDPEANGTPVFKFIGPRNWASQSFKKIFSAL